MISILFEYYKIYKNEGLTIPDSVKSYTKTYFANESIKGWIDENFEQCIKGHTELKQIAMLYAEATDKKLSVRQLREELMGLGYTVTKNNGEYSLKSWILKREQIEQNCDSTDEEDNIGNVEE